MPLSEELLEIICCPETHKPLREMNQSELQRVNAAIQAGELKTIEGKAVGEEVDGALLCEEANRFYPIRQDIPVLLVEEAIPLSENFFGAS